MIEMLAPPVRVTNDETLNDDDSTSRHRKRVVKAVGAVTFLLLLFSVVLIGVSLNMGKEIDELVRQSTLSMRNSKSSFLTRRDNMTSQSV